LGFVALAVRQILIGGNRTGIIVRLAVAVAFAALAWFTFRNQPRRG
jgi:hypothetical protein